MSLVLDKVLLPVHDEEVALLVAVADVAGAEPIAEERAGGLGGVAVVAKGHGSAYTEREQYESWL